jgi:hypothetical protein
MHELYNLKDKLVKELGEFGHRELSETSLKTIDTLAHAAKNVGKVIECCEDEEYSMAMMGDGGYSRGMSCSDGRSYAGDGSRDFVRPDGSYRYADASYARGRGRGAKRDAMGRYSSAGGDDIRHGLQELMNSAGDERTRREIKELMDRM